MESDPETARLTAIWQDLGIKAPLDEPGGPPVDDDVLRLVIARDPELNAETKKRIADLICRFRLWREHLVALVAEETNRG